MDGSNILGDAEMRLITINGQTIMLEGDFDNMNVTNEFLNEMLMVNSSKDDIDDGCGEELNENPCTNGIKETNDEPTKLEISIQGENNELETIQIGMEEAKALGLCFYGVKNDENMSNWDNCTFGGVEEPVVKEGDEKAQRNVENCKMKLHPVPVVSVGCLDREPSNLLPVDQVTKFEETTNPSEAFPFNVPSKVEKLSKAVQEDSSDNLPAIGHLEGFQIPTTEDGVLLPATVNAKMADGSYQMITLVPQVVNGTVTYTLHFSNFGKDAIDKNLCSALHIKENYTESLCNGIDSISKDIINNEINSVEEFLNSVQSIKNEQVKNILPDNSQKVSENKVTVSGFMNSSTDESVLKINRSNDFTGTSNDLPVNFMVQNQVPIETKIDNLISENENVISKCKKVKYGKKLKTSDSEASLQVTSKMTKSNITKAKKVKFKNKGVKLSVEDVEQKKLKLSLLKPSNDYRLDLSNKKGFEANKPVNTNSMPHMNLNGRLEYPNLKAIDETASSLSYLKVKSSNATKQPYFNVLPYPKDKTIPVQKQILPLNCDLQQAKNLISLQKFLETQKLQLKIQPIVSNGNKIINIKPKPTLSEEFKVLKDVGGTLNHMNNNKLKEKLCTTEGFRDGPEPTQENESLKKPYLDNVNMKDVLLSDGKLNCLKFLKPSNSECCVESEKDSSSDCSNKVNGIFIKNNPEYFSQKFKDGKDEHPLGSSENPIQLVQTGHTFHSRQPLSETQLRQIASILQKQKFDSPNIRKNSIFDPKTNTRIVYRVVYPEDVELKDADRTSAEGITKRKRGRHKTKTVATEEDILKKPSPLPRGPGRPKKTQVSTLEEEVLEEEVDDSTPKKKIPRTRSGRLSRPPRYMVKDYKRLNNSDASEKTLVSNYDSDETYSASTATTASTTTTTTTTTYQNGKKIPLERTDNIEELELETNLLPGLRPQQRSKRNFKPEYRCPTCQKIYLGHTRMMWHLNKFPDHCNVEKYKENYYRKRTETKVRRAARRLNLCDVTSKVKQVLNSMSKEELTSLCGPILAEALTTWDFLLLRVNLLKDTKKDEVDALLHELVNLLEKLTKLAEDIFLPVFTKEAEKDEDCVEIDRMEVAIALGLPVGFYKVNNDNLNLLRLPLKSSSLGQGENAESSKVENEKANCGETLFPPTGKEEEEKKEVMFRKKSDPWEDESKNGKKLEEESFWLERKGVEETDGWHRPEDSSLKTLSTKFEPNLSTKILESSNDSLDDGKYEEPVHRLMDMDSNSKDVEQSNSSGDMDVSTVISIVEDRAKMSDEVPGKEEERRTEEKDSTGLWGENSTDKVSAELWNENHGRGKWDENSEISNGNEKPPPHLWNENSNLTSGGKVDETNSEFLDSLLSVPNSNEFLGNESGGFLSENIGLMNDKGERIKSTEPVDSKNKMEWRNDGEDNNYMRVWETEKTSSWPKEESILSGSLRERMPGVRTTGRLPSTPETNGNMSFSIPNRRNSISDFSNINLESSNLDMVLPPAKTLIKDCLKDEETKFEIKNDVSGSFLQGPVKNWTDRDAGKSDFASANVNSEDLMKMALESLTVQHDVINVPSSSFDSAMGILNQAQEGGNLNIFASSETDALDFNLPLPEHLLRSNFASPNFQTTCAPNFPSSSESPAFLSTTSNIFGTTSTISNSMKFDHFEGNFPGKKSKSLDDVMEFFEAKNAFNSYETCGGNESNNMNNFGFGSSSSHVDEEEDEVDDEDYSVRGTLNEEENGRDEMKKKTKGRLKNGTGNKKPSSRKGKGSKKARTAAGAKSKKSVDYAKSKTIESIINEALFDSCGSNPKVLRRMEDSSPDGNSAIPNRTDNYSLPIIPESLDEVENLDFLNQD